MLGTRRRPPAAALPPSLLSVSLHATSGSVLRIEKKGKKRCDLRTASLMPPAKAPLSPACACCLRLCVTPRSPPPLAIERFGIQSPSESPVVTGAQQTLGGRWGMGESLLYLPVELRTHCKRGFEEFASSSSICLCKCDCKWLFVLTCTCDKVVTCLTRHRAFAL